jgi:hypothetical protein
MDTGIQLPPWLRYSKINIAIIFDRQGKITDSNELWADIFITGEQKNISHLFSSNEITELNKQLQALHLNSNNIIQAISTAKKRLCFSMGILIIQ